MSSNRKGGPSGASSAPRGQQGKKSTPPISGKSTPNTATRAVPGAAKAPAPATRPAASASTASTTPMDPMKFVLTTMIGQRVTVLLKDGSKWEGLFHMGGPLTDATSGSLNIELSMAVQVSSATQPSIDTLQVIPQQKLKFSDSDLVAVTAKGISADPTGPRGVVGFQTDSEISTSVHGKERTLQSWADISEADIARVGGLGDENSLNGWDQFEVNKSRYGVQTTYSEELYTTSLDKGSDFYRQREAEAARLASEIEKEVTSNPHLAEERGQKAEDDGLDEEDKYSSVIRNQTGAKPAKNATQAPRNFAAVAAGKAGGAASNATGQKYVVPARRSDSPAAPNGKADSSVPDEGTSSPRAPSSPTLSGRRGSRGAKDPSIVLARQQELTSTSPAASPKVKPQSPTVSSKLASLQLDSSSPRVHERHAEELAQLAAQAGSPSTQRREHDIASFKKFSTAIDTKIDSKAKKEGDDDAGAKLNPNAKEFKPGMSIMSLISGGKPKSAAPSSGPQIVNMTQPAPVAAMSYNASQAYGMGATMPTNAAYGLTPAPLNSFFDRPTYADTSSSISVAYSSAVKNRLKTPRTGASTRSPVFVGSETWADPGAPPRRASYKEPAPAIVAVPVEPVAPQQPYGYYSQGYEYAYPVQPMYTNAYMPGAYGYQYSGGFPAQGYPASPPQNRAAPQPGGSPVAYAGGYAQTSPSGAATKRPYFNPNSPGFVPQTSAQTYQQGYQPGMPYYPQTPPK